MSFGNKCLPCVCPEQWAQGTTTYREAVLKILCGISLGEGGSVVVLCDDNGPFFRAVSPLGVVTNFTLDGAEYAPVGAVGVCPAGAALGVISWTEDLCLYVSDTTEGEILGMNFDFSTPDTEVQRYHRTTGALLGTIPLTTPPAQPVGLALTADLSEIWIIQSAIPGQALYRYAYPGGGAVIASPAITGYAGTAAEVVTGIELNPLTGVMWAVSVDQGDAGANMRLYTLANDGTLTFERLLNDHSTETGGYGPGIAFLPSGYLFLFYSTGGATVVKGMWPVDWIEALYATPAPYTSGLHGSTGTPDGRMLLSATGVTTRYLSSGAVLGAAINAIPATTNLAFAPEQAVGVATVPFKRVFIKDLDEDVVTTQDHDPETGADVVVGPNLFGECAVVPDCPCQPAGTVEDPVFVSQDLTTANYASGTLAFGGVTTAYATLLVPGNAYRQLEIDNKLDKDVWVSFGGGVNHRFVAAGTTKSWDLAANAAFDQTNLIRVKSIGGNATSGDIYASVLLET